MAGNHAELGGLVGTDSAPGCLPSQYRMDGAMTSSDEYRRRAGECLLFTQYVTSERSKHLLVEMARSWHDLAERAEQQKTAAIERDRLAQDGGNTEPHKT